MLLIPCPWCGACAQVEFSYGGDAARRRPPDPGQCSVEEWLDHVYLRDNPRGAHLEWWQHNAGCRQWIQVLRNTQTHEVMGAWDANARVEAPAAPAPEHGK